MLLKCPVFRCDTISFLIRRFGNILLLSDWLPVIMVESITLSDDNNNGNKIIIIATIYYLAPGTLPNILQVLYRLSHTTTL